MAIKARLKVGAKIQTTAIGLEGAPYHASPGAVVTFPSEAAFKKAVALYEDGAFELIEEKAAPAASSGKKAASAAKKGDRK